MVVQKSRIVHGYSKYITIIISCTALVIFTAALPLYADIYMYIDKKNCFHFTNIPTSSKYRLYIKEKPAKSSRLHRTKKYDDYIKEASKRHGVAFPLIKAIMKVESDFNSLAVSKKGAMGLMQIMPQNIKTLRIKDPFNPRENIMGGTSYFKQLLNRFDGKIKLALAAYHAGPNNVDRYKRIPPFKETEDYVRRVMKYYYAATNQATPTY